LLSNFPPAVYAKIVAHEDVFGLPTTPGGFGGKAREAVSVDGQSIHAVFNDDARAFVDSHGCFGLGGAFVLTATDVGVAEGVARIVLRSEAAATLKEKRWAMVKVFALRGQP
jgi:hypothetical protein